MSFTGTFCLEIEEIEIHIQFTTCNQILYSCQEAKFISVLKIESTQGL